MTAPHAALRSLVLLAYTLRSESRRVVGLLPRTAGPSSAPVLPCPRCFAHFAPGLRKDVWCPRCGEHYWRSMKPVRNARERQKQDAWRAFSAAGAAALNLDTDTED